MDDTMSGGQESGSFTLPPKKVHWPITDQERLSQSSRIDPKLSAQVHHCSNRSHTWVAFTTQIKQPKNSSKTMDFLIGMLNHLP